MKADPKWTWAEFFNAIPREECPTCFQRAWMPTIYEAQWACSQCGGTTHDSYPGRTPLRAVPTAPQNVIPFKFRRSNFPPSG